ncbi:Protein SEC13, partial [Eschrichtius robustus]|nr:Protein SEC13 [Eschrichtius robustus]
HDAQMDYYGTRLATCSSDRSVKIFDVRNGGQILIADLRGRVNSVCWAPHDYGLILACGSSDGAISLLTYTGLGQWEVKKINNAHT